MKTRLFPAFLVAVALMMSSQARANAVVDSPGAAGVLGDNSAAAAAQANASLKSKNVSGSKSSVVVNNANNYTGQTGAPSGYSGNTNIDARSAPSIALAPLYGGGARCPTVGLTGVGTGTGGGGGAGISYYSTDCSAIELAEYFRSIGRPDVGTAVIIHQFSWVGDVIGTMPKPKNDVVSLPPSDRSPGWTAPSWCFGPHMTDAKRAAQASCHG